MIKYISALFLSLVLVANTHAQGFVAVGGSWGGVAVGTGYYGGYGGYYGGYGAVAPIGGWYPAGWYPYYGYTSPLYAAPIPQVVPVVQQVVQTVPVQQQPCQNKTCNCNK
jgi:hypothetical protein